MSIEINGAGTITGVDSLSTPAVTNAAGSASSPSITFTGDTNTGLYSPGADQVAVTTGGTARLFVDASGRLLVGTSTSRNDFFNGTTTVAGGIQLELSASDNLNRFMSFTSNNSDTGGPSFLFGKSRGTTANSKTVVQSDDQLAAFNFHGADGSDMVEAARISAHVDGTPGANDVPGRLVFSTTADGASSPTERARITSAGASWATTTGSYRYQAATCHEFTVNNNGEYALFISNTNSTSPLGVVVKYDTDINNTANTPFKFQGGTTDRFVVRSNGGLANYQANDVNLSDINAKKDISPAAGTWDCLKQWEIVNYRYKDQPDDADLNLGVIAQQVAESCPEVITVFEEATEDLPEKLGIKEQQMYWMAIKALQEAQVRIEALEAEVAALKAS